MCVGVCGWIEIHVVWVRVCDCLGVFDVCEVCVCVCGWECVIVYHVEEWSGGEGILGSYQRGISHIAGNLVLVVNGGYSGLRATLEAIDLDTYSASVKIAQVLCGLYSKQHIQQ